MWTANCGDRVPRSRPRKIAAYIFTPANLISNAARAPGEHGLDTAADFLSRIFAPIDRPFQSVYDALLHFETRCWVMRGPAPPITTVCVSLTAKEDWKVLSYAAAGALPQRD